MIQDPSFEATRRRNLGLRRNGPFSRNRRRESMINASPWLISVGVVAAAIVYTVLLFTV